MIEITAVGGYSEVGKNMTAVKYKDDVILLDMGLQVDRYIQVKDESEEDYVTYRDLMQEGAVPDTRCIKDWRKHVRAIIPTHAHLDHLGAIPYMADRFEDAEIICTRFSAAVLQALITEQPRPIMNTITVLDNNSHYRISDDLSVEFINITHSTPDTVMVVIHTPEGAVAYCNDFKLDETPILGQPPNFRRMKELGEEGVKLLIMDSLYSRSDRHTPSEAKAREMLREVMLGIRSEGRTVITTTFSSHIARLKAIGDFSKRMGRKPIFMGRSLHKYCTAAEECGLYNFSEEVEIAGYRRLVRKRLGEIDRLGREKYLLVVTGHQGERDSVLSRIVRGEFDIQLSAEDMVIFSCNVIPQPQNIASRQELEASLAAQNVRMFKDIHQSGHASRRDHAQLIGLLQPQHILPSHGSPDQTSGILTLAEELGLSGVITAEDGYRFEV